MADGKGTKDQVESWELPAGGYELLTKAKENYLCAKRAFAERHYNVAASRFYYALHQATMELFDAKRLQPPPVKEEGVEEVERAPRWTHGTLHFGLLVAGVGHHRRLMAQCYAMRRQADYDRLPIDGDYYGRYLQRILRMLDELRRLVTESQNKESR